MNVVHFSTRLSDGAGRATYRLHKGLQAAGISSTIVVKHKEEPDDSVIQLFRNNLSDPANPHGQKKSPIKHAIGSLPFLFREFQQRKLFSRWQPKTLFNYNLPFASVSTLDSLLTSADIVCLHSIQYFLSTKLIRQIQAVSGAPIVWTMMDVEPFTGGCHFHEGCEGFVQRCGNCPQMISRSEDDLSRRVWNEKYRDLTNLPITFVAPTSNIKKLIAKSALFGNNRTERIPLSVSEIIFRPIEKSVARQALGLPLNKNLIVFGAFNLSDHRKGGHLLLEALGHLSALDKPGHILNQESAALVTIGTRNDFDARNAPIDWIHLGKVNDERILNLLYHAADVYACPSVDDVGPLMINEAYMCQLPVVAFNSGVAPDLISAKGAGRLVECFDTNLFAQALSSILHSIATNPLEGSNTLPDLCSSANQAKQYLNLFGELSGRSEVPDMSS